MLEFADDFEPVPCLHGCADLVARVQQHASRAMSMSAYQPLLTRMSPGLRGQVTRLTDKNWVERLPYFRNVPETFVVELVQALGCQAFPPGQF